jgi:hypothetical protein
MRFFEFQLPQAGTNLSAAIEAELAKLGNIVDQKPEVEATVNAELEKLIAMAQAETSEEQKPEVAPPEKPVETPIDQPPPEETKENMFGEAAATMSRTDYLIDTLMAEIGNIVDNTKKKMYLKMVQNIAAEAKKEEFQTGRSVDAAVKQSAKILAAKISGTLEALKQQYDEQFQEGDPQAPKRKTLPADELNQELIDLIEGIFNKPISRADTPQTRNDTAKQILDFMKRCETGIVDLKAKVAQGKGNILGGISQEDKNILDMLENALMKAKPGKTAGNWGPGELGLAILGTPVNKASKGDLDVGGEMIELKASQNPRKGGRLGTKALARGTDGKKNYMPALDELMKAAGYGPNNLSYNASSKNYIGNYQSSSKSKTVKSPQVFHTSFGQTFIEKALNPKIQGKVTKETTAKFLKAIALSCIVEEYKSMVKTDWVVSCANADGTINNNMFTVKYAGMLYSLYKRVDGVGKIMVLNPLTGSYRILQAPSDLGKFSKGDEEAPPIQFSTEIINYNDSQGKASPQIGI